MTSSSVGDMLEQRESVAEGSAATEKGDASSARLR